MADAAIIGGGFYGCEIALELRRLGFERVVILERECGLMRRASYVNQARIHNGYHYPRSLLTAERSRRNFERFVHDYADAIDFAMTKLYAIARESRVNAAQFERFCATIGAPCQPAPARLARLFDDNLIEEVFLTREFAFDACAMAQTLMDRLNAAGVEVMLATEARVVSICDDAVVLATPHERLQASYVFNCTYAELDLVGVPLRSALKRELTEMALIEPPAELRGLGVTIMDGPFFSAMPFPAAKLHSLSHVRYTPHEAWTHSHYGRVAPRRSSREAMIRDAARYLPCLAKARFVRSLFDLKAVLSQNENDDGRPILIELSPTSQRICSVLGSKIDNVYEAREYICAQSWVI